MTIDIYFDCETTGISCYNDEIIEAYFHISDDNNFYLKCCPDKWSYEAEEIHKIPQNIAMTYPSKKKAFREFLEWLPSDFRFVTYANKNTALGHINFDVAILVNELNLLGCKNYFLEMNYKMKQNISVHTMARESSQNGLFRPIRRKSATGKMIQSLSQENVYKALFGRNYDNAHNCVQDVKMMCQIKDELIRLNNETRTNLI